MHSFLIAEPIERTPLFHDLLISVLMVTRLINGEMRNLPAVIESNLTMNLLGAKLVASKFENMKCKIFQDQPHS